MKNHISNIDKQNMYNKFYFNKADNLIKLLDNIDFEKTADDIFILRIIKVY